MLSYPGLYQQHGKPLLWRERKFISGEPGVGMVVNMEHGHFPHSPQTIHLLQWIPLPGYNPIVNSLLSIPLLTWQLRIAVLRCVRRAGFRSLYGRLAQEFILILIIIVSSRSAT